MLIDLHAHTSGISKCCNFTASQIIESARSVQIDGIVLTNHYQKSYIADGSADEFSEKYINEFYYTKEQGDKVGIKTYFGIEVTMELYLNVHMLIYGVSENFLKKHLTMYEYTQKELFDAVKKNGGVLIQAHPFRYNTTVLDTDYLDGIEINCHPIYKNSFSQKIVEIANDKRLLVTCGGDFHADTYRPKCGMFLPDDINDSIELGKYLLRADDVKLCVQEPNDEKIDEYVFRKKNICP